MHLKLSYAQMVALLSRRQYVSNLQMYHQQSIWYAAETFRTKHVMRIELFWNIMDTYHLHILRITLSNK